MKKKQKQPAVIEAVDEVLSLLREKWMNEKDDKKKVELSKKIDSVLDERLRLMKLRDSGEL
jgi:hypothetical protein